jgi:hypothetical protein
MTSPGNARGTARASRLRSQVFQKERQMKSRNFSLAIAMSVLLASAFVPGFGQRTTEQFIPIGKSPGLSGKHSSIGEIETYDAESRALTIVTPAGKQTLALTDQTRIWLDRSKQKLASAKGEVAELKKGRKVEVKYADAERKTGAEWIKVEIAP